MDEEESDAPYHLFERLNTTGTPLTPQEIRSALYFGPFNDLLIQLDNEYDWNKIVKKDIRLTGQEYILRLIAFHYDFNYYNGNMKSFLNQFMMRNRELNHFSKYEVEFFFLPTIKFLSEILPPQKRHFNIAFFEPIFYFISKERLYDKSASLVSEIVKQLSNDEEYLKLNISSTTSRSSIYHRFEFVKSKLTELL